jgi:hypothetical protein
MTRLLFAILLIAGCSTPRPAQLADLSSLPDRMTTDAGTVPSPDVAGLASGPRARFPLDPPATGTRPAPTPTPRTATPPLGTIADAKAWALRRLGRTQYRCLAALVQRESRWNPLARNRRSGAWGLPQALPGSRMASAGADWRTNPKTQLAWMVSYVNARYGGACNAYRRALEIGWY